MRYEAARPGWLPYWARSAGDISSAAPEASPGGRPGSQFLQAGIDGHGFSRQAARCRNAGHLPEMSQFDAEF
jgi:hypothetical protein